MNYKPTGCSDMQQREGVSPQISYRSELLNPQHYRHFGSENSVGWGAALCVVGCVAASLPLPTGCQQHVSTPSVTTTSLQTLASVPWGPKSLPAWDDFQAQMLPQQTGEYYRSPPLWPGPCFISLEEVRCPWQPLV